MRRSPDVRGPYGRRPTIGREEEIFEGIRRTVRARRGETVRLLRDLVRVPSVSGEEGAVQEVVRDAFLRSGLAVEHCEATAEQMAPYAEHVGKKIRFEGRPNIIGVRAGRGGGGGSLLLNAHVDTVGNGDPSAWTYPPLSGEVVGDPLYGRGRGGREAAPPAPPRAARGPRRPRAPRPPPALRRGGRRPPVRARLVRHEGGPRDHRRGAGRPRRGRGGGGGRALGRRRRGARPAAAPAAARPSWGAASRPSSGRWTPSGRWAWSCAATSPSRRRW